MMRSPQINQVLSMLRANGRGQKMLCREFPVLLAFFASSATLFFCVEHNVLLSMAEFRCVEMTSPSAILTKAPMPIRLLLTGEYAPGDLRGVLPPAGW